MIDFDFDKFCYGCAACSQVCPVGAIEMVKNNEGFKVPVVNKNKCIKCGLCEKKCPYLNEKEENKIDKGDIIKAVYRKEKKEYRSYTSSGIFNAIALSFIKSGGYVCGCIWNENMEAIHIVTNDINEIKKMCYSKYVQSDIKNVYAEIEDLLKNNKKVLICGTPCQIFAIKRFMEKYSTNLYTISIVCHGTPSPEVWKKYKEKLEKEQGSKMINANFRYKGKYGWITPFSKYDFLNGKSIQKLSFADDEYIIAFGRDALHRNSCYRCKFKGSNSNADLITGDFWGCSNDLLKLSKNKGISAVIIHSEKGKKMLEDVKDIFESKDINIDMMTKENGPVLYPVKYNKSRDKFYLNFKEQQNIDGLSKIKTSKKNNIKTILYKLHLFELLKRITYYFKHRK